MEDKIFRVEKDGMGIYHGRYDALYNRNEIFQSLGDPKRHPEPEFDEILIDAAPFLFIENESGKKIWNGKDYIFGFKDFGNFRAWLYDDNIIGTLHLEGFMVHELGGQVYHGHRQSVINKNTKKELRRWNILDFIITQGHD